MPGQVAGFVLVDTDVLSYTFKKDSRAYHFQSYLDAKKWAISFMTVAEIELWMLRYGWSEKRQAEMEEHLARCTVIPFDNRLCRAWAEVTDLRRSQGKPIECADAWIAATALLYDLPLATHNGKHFAGIPGVEVISV
jgi:tRNA(fMet)-specific endonuclease VapC